MHHSIIKAGIDLSTVSAIAVYWGGYLPGIIGVIATSASAAWYLFCLYEAYEKRRNRKNIN